MVIQATAQAVAKSWLVRASHTKNLCVRQAIEQSETTVQQKKNK